MILPQVTEPQVDISGDSSRVNILNSSVLVLNKYFAVVHVCTLKRAVDLLYNEHAEVMYVDREMYLGFNFNEWVSLSQDPRSYLESFEFPDSQDWIRTVSIQFIAPRVIRLLDYDRIPKWEVKLNRRNILLRDNLTCQYCNRKFPPARLSVDHVVPRSRGGKSEWTNLITACMRCNTRKGNKLPKEAGMIPRSQPHKPHFTNIFNNHLCSPRYSQWAQFLRAGDSSRAPERRAS